jgi:fatty acid synthase subunit alpha, fungi type
MNSEKFLKFQAEQHEFTHQQINLYSRYLMRDPRQGEILYDKEKTRSLQIQARLHSIGREHGDTYIEGIQPVTSTLPGNGFVKTPFLCSMTSFPAASPPSIVRSLRVASPS